MKRITKTICALVMVFALLLFAACSNSETQNDPVASPATETTIELDMTSSYDVYDPFVNAKLFCVTDDAATVNFDASFQMTCESGLLEIADNDTNEVIWSQSWQGSADDSFTIELGELSSDKDYVVRLTCTKVEHANLTMTADGGLVQELETPRIIN